ncbi:MAG: branched-chain amino acid ABC transporter substrate-binding protein [Chloroflexi bacterium]|nr:branched-chain amino acid ABC transporter substrate-binding protein [Chloroflexota bacterium]
MLKKLRQMIALTISAITVSACVTNPTTLKIVSSLPLTGSARPQSLAITNAMQLRVEQANGKACGGKYKVVYESWDDASEALGKWDPILEAQNANNAVNDPSIIAYLGTFNSGAAEISMPILNRAGMVMISPGNTYPGLTHEVEGMTAPGEPYIYFPTGVRNYARLVATDDLQGPVIVNFMISQGVKSVFIINDGEVYGKGVAEAVRLSAAKAGVEVVGNETFDPTATSYADLMKIISTSDNGGAPDAIFYGGIIENNVAQILKDKIAALGDNQQVKFIGPDGIYTEGLVESAGSAAEGVFATIPGLALKDLGEMGRKFYADYEKKFGKTDEAYAIIGYETMNVVLYAIETVCANGGDPTDRKTIRDTVLATREFEGALGIWSFNENGDITIPYFLVGQVQNGNFTQFGTYTP